MSPLNTSDLNIDPDLRAWIDPLSPDEFAQLEANILADGCRDAIVVWGGYILDGHNRYEICKRHNVAFTTVEKTGLATKDDALIWMGEHQLGKRNLSDFSRAALALRLKPLMEQQARARMLAGRAPAADPVQISSQGSGKTRDELARRAGVSHDTVRKVEKILESGNVEVTAQVRAGEISINAAAKKVAPQRAPVAATPPAVSPTTAPAARPTLVRQAQEQASRSADEAALLPDTVETDPFEKLHEDFDALQRAHDKLRTEKEALEAQVAFLSQDDMAAEAQRWKSNFEGISGRNAGLTKKLNDLEPDAEYMREILQQIRQALGVERNSDIVPALKARRAA